jgi:hypothetical protein
MLINDLEYNTEREHLIIPEYGRHMQKMINYAKELPTKEERDKSKYHPYPLEEIAGLNHEKFIKSISLVDIIN